MDEKLMIEKHLENKQYAPRTHEVPERLVSAVMLLNVE